MFLMNSHLIKCCIYTTSMNIELKLSLPPYNIQTRFLKSLKTKPKNEVNFMLNQTEFRGKYNSIIVLYQKNPTQIYIINEKEGREKQRFHSFLCNSEHMDPCFTTLLHCNCDHIHSSAIQNIWILVSLLFFTVIVIII